MNKQKYKIQNENKLELKPMGKKSKKEVIEIIKKIQKKLEKHNQSSYQYPCFS
jgi:hypothetical protein